MSSSSLYSAPATMNSKRHSLNVSTGPRPLHLLDGNAPSVLQLQPGPATAPLYSTSPEFSAPSPNPRRANHTPRRQSSISYNPRNRYSDHERSPLSSGSPKSALSRSNSLGPKINGKGFNNVTGLQERPPLTLTEKHSELLHFIAQKESKCLELRSQLAIHEAELLQLKRKWERIINRGFDKSTLDGTSSQSQGNGAVLEGIREGVQGVSRFITAGLAISELSTPTPSPSSHPTSPPIRRTHSAAPSTNSSISTFTTKSTRFSQSSASSLGEEPTIDCTPSDGDPVQVLMVQDTGATPTMSPNPAFMHKQQQLQEQQEELTRSIRSTLAADQQGYAPTLTTNAKMHRRKSRDVSILADVASPPPEIRPASPLSDPSAKLEETKAKRASFNGSTLPPISSIPGLGSLTIGAASPPVSSWVGTVGKKWEELQRGSTFSKNQKRASVLLSDVSQSIVSALSASVPSSASTSPTPPSPYFSPLHASPFTTSSTTNSLLDDDDDCGFLGSSSIMTPTPKLTPSPQPSKSSLHPHTSLQPIPQGHSKAQDEDDEWNW